MEKWPYQIAGRLWPLGIIWTRKLFFVMKLQKTDIWNRCRPTSPKKITESEYAKAPCSYPLLHWSPILKWTKNTGKSRYPLWVLSWAQTRLLRRTMFSWWECIPGSPMDSNVLVGNFIGSQLFLYCQLSRNLDSCFSC